MPKLPSYVVSAIAQKIFDKTVERIEQIIQETKQNPEFQTALKKTKESEEYLKLMKAIETMEGFKKEREEILKKEKALFAEFGFDGWRDFSEEVEKQRRKILENFASKWIPPKPELENIKARVWLKASTNINEEEFINEFVEELLK